MKSLYSVPLPVALLVASFLAPTELSLFVAGLRLPPHRIALILLVAIALGRVFRGKVRLKSYDVVFALFGTWSIIVFTLHAGHAGLVYGGSLALESFGAYIVARAFIRTRIQYVASLSLLLAMVVASALLALPEMVLGRHFTHDTLQSLTGFYVERAVEVRKGLTRAYATFDHPIHLGVFCASILTLAIYTSRSTGQWMRRGAIVIVATLTAMSSAPLLCIALQIGLIVWERTTRGVANRIPLTLAVAVGLYIGLSLVSNRSPVQLLATGFTLDSWTGYYRMLIWQYGLDNVWAHPVIGIGHADWQRPQWMAASTVDAFWLLVAMQQGLPAITLLLLAIVLLARSVGRRVRRTRDAAERAIGRAWIMALIALSAMAATVHLWNVPHAYFFFFLGSAGWLADPARVRRPVRRARGLDAEGPLPRFLHGARPALPVPPLTGAVPA